MESPDRWHLIDEIFYGALERPSVERSAYLTQACGDDAELRSEIESLLANDASANLALDSLISSDLRQMVQGADAAEIGQRVGPYRLVRELDSGGMGLCTWPSVPMINIFRSWP